MILIFIGWVIGIVGDIIEICPTLFPDACYSATIYLAQHNGMVVYSHLFYQLFTSILVTASPLDAGFNIIAVLILDRLTFDTFGKAKYFLVFFLTAILGNLLTLSQGPFYSSAGASGGIFGIFAAILSYSWLKENKIEKSAIVFFLIVFLSSSFFLPTISSLAKVNWVAHLGGAIGGFIAGPLIYYSTPKTEVYESNSEKNRNMDYATAILIALFAVGSVVQFTLFVF